MKIGVERNEKIKMSEMSEKITLAKKGEIKARANGRILFEQQMRGWRYSYLERVSLFIGKW